MRLLEMVMRSGDQWTVALDEALQTGDILLGSLLHCNGLLILMWVRIERGHMVEVIQITCESV